MLMEEEQVKFSFNKRHYQYVIKLLIDVKYLLLKSILFHPANL